MLKKYKDDIKTDVNLNKFLSYRKKPSRILYKDEMTFMISL